MYLNYLSIVKFLNGKCHTNTNMLVFLGYSPPIGKDGWVGGLFMGLMVWVSFLFCTLCHGQNSIPKPLHNASTIQKARIWHDTAGNATAQMAYQILKNGQFSEVPLWEGKINRGFAFEVVWLTLPFARGTLLPSAQNLWMSFGNGGIYKVNYYWLNGSNQAIDSLPQVGRLMPFGQRHLPIRHFAFPAPKIDSGLLLWRIDMRGNTFDLQLNWSNKEALLSEEQKHRGWYAFFCGMLLLAATLSLAGFMTTGHMLFIHYTIYIVLGILLFLSDGGLDFPWLYPNAPRWASTSTAVYAFLNTAAMLSFAASFLALKKERPSLHRVIMGSALVLILFACIVLAIYNHPSGMEWRLWVVEAGILILIGSWLLHLYVVARRIIDGYFQARLYGFAILMAVVCAIFYFLHALNLIQSRIPPFDKLITGYALEILVLNVAMLWRYRTTYDKVATLERTLDDSKQQTKQQIIEAEENERAKMSADLHDELGSEFSSLQWQLAGSSLPDSFKTEWIEKLQVIADKSRQLAHALAPAPDGTTPGNSLTERLALYVTQLNRSDKLSANFEGAEPDPPLQAEVQIQLYRMALELVQNSLKHARATCIYMRMMQDVEHLQLSVTDNGIGFIPEQINPGLGMKTLYSRAALIDAAITIQSKPGNTTIDIKIPLPLYHATNISPDTRR